jgi:hypothetical protein
VVFTVVVYALLELTGANESTDLGLVLDIALGSLFLYLGVSAYFSHESPEEEQAKRQRIEKIASGSVRSLLVAGVAVQIINSDALAMYAGGLKEIALEQPGPQPPSWPPSSPGDHVASLLLPSRALRVFPGRSRKVLVPMNDWLLGHLRPLEVVVGLAFGIGFLSKGIGGLT